MSGQVLPLALVPPGREVTLVAINGGRGLRMRLTEMGLVEGIKLRVVTSQRPGPCVVALGGARLALGHGMAQKILVKEVYDGNC